ncbi:MAG: NAD(P)/FAD-dependent oxidoreductase [Cyclobacteriaceae bacterium]
MKNLKRRDFIKTTVTASMGASFIVPGLAQANKSYQAQPEKASPVLQQKKKIIVAGAGIGGLCCGYELMRRGYEVIILEASPRHGGHIFTVHDGLSDGLYADFGAEHITKPGYERYWEYTREFNLTVLPYPRRINVLRRIDGKFYTEEMLADPSILKQFGFNAREVKFLSENPWWDLQSLYVRPYHDKFKDEYQPFGVGYDHLDKVPMSDIYKKDGASASAMERLGGKNSSALFELWRTSILTLRGVPLAPPNVFRLKGGNQELPNAFAKRLGDRVKLGCPITSITHSPTGVTVSYKEFGEEKKMSADFLANCIPLPAFKTIPITPALPPAKQFVVDNVVYDSYSRFVFQARSKFWLDDNLSINMDLGHPDISSIWQVADEVDTHRVALQGTGPGGVSAQRALAAFREVYPGKHDTIEQALVRDWTKEEFAFTCERLNFPMGQLSKFWPHVMTPHGRIHFAGAYADNLNWGMEAATRSANRVAKEIEQA